MSQPFYDWMCTSNIGSLVSVALFQLKWTGAAVNSLKKFNLICSVNRFKTGIIVLNFRSKCKLF